MKKILSVFFLSLLLSHCTFHGKNTVQHPEDSDIEFTLMAFNIYLGGFSAGSLIEQSAKAIEASGADIVALQEHAISGPIIAKKLGWDIVIFDFDNAIISRYKIVDTMKQGAVIELNSKQRIALFDVHLDPYPYGPYNLRDKPELSEEALITTANEYRRQETKGYLKHARPFIEKGMPVFFAGDFNEPSHLDWTEDAVAQGIRTKTVRWPTSSLMTQSGFIDAYREIYPDPVAHAGNTWTPTPGENEIHDRIDFIYYQGSQIKVIDAKLVGPEDAISDIAVEPYPSDHRAVIAKFRIQ